MVQAFHAWAFAGRVGFVTGPGPGRGSVGRWRTSWRTR